MRLALLSDVHANVEALDAVLSDADAWGPDAVVCAGDLVGYGPDPAACVERLRRRGALCIAGNHEGMVLGTIGFERCAHAGIRAALWTRARLSREVHDFLAALPATRRVADAVVCHGSLDDPEHYLASAARADAALSTLARLAPDAAVLVAGHTHHPMLYRAGAPWRRPPPGAPLRLAPGSPWLVNPGSVGQSRDDVPAARYVRYDTAAREVEFRDVEYAHEATVEKLRRAGLVARVCLPPKVGLAAKVDALRTRWARLRAPPATLAKRAPVAERGSDAR